METFSGPFPRSGFMSNGRLYPLPMSGRRTYESASGLWPTPIVKGDYNKAGLSAKSGDGLATAVRMWPTPHGFSPDGKSNGPSGNELGRAVNRSMWPTPSALDWKGALASLDTLPLNSRPLNEMVRFATPHANCHTGAGSSGRDGGENLQTQIGGSLNPTWVEWLMGLPSGWTDLGA